MDRGGDIEIRTITHPEDPPTEPVIPTVPETPKPEPEPETPAQLPQPMMEDR